MTLPNYLSFALNFLRFFGIPLQTPQTSKRTKIFIRICTIFALIAIPICGVLTFIAVTARYFNEILVYVQLLIIFFTAYIIVLEVVLTKAEQLRFWGFIKKIEELYLDGSLNLDLKYKKFSRYQIRRIVGMFIFTIAIYVFVVSVSRFFEDTENMATNWTVTWLFYYYAVLVARIRHHSHILVIQILKMHVEFFNEDLERMGKILKLSINKDVAKELDVIKFRHAYLWEAITSANKCHRWSQLFNIAEDLYMFIQSLYWTYICLKTNNFFSACKCLIFALPSICDIFHLCYSCEKLHDEADKSGSILLKFLKYRNDSISLFTKNCIVELTLQMHHEKIRIAVGRIFTLNMAFLTVISGTLVTYLVILIQFL
uniref:Gustatory receptor n=1 Tax=Lutzomyia longipalpis TaxID=7200 RepID=A0A240SXZ3_LUTLO